MSKPLNEDDWISGDDLVEDTGRALLERDIEKAVSGYAAKRGWRHMKFQSANYRSVPDRVFFKAGGKIFFIEFKRHLEKPTPKQEKEIARLRSEGFTVFVVDNIEFGLECIDLMG